MLEANAAAANLMNKPLKRLMGSMFESMFDGDDAERIQGMLMALRSTGRADEVSLTLDGRQKQAVLSATIFRQENATYYLMRLQPLTVGRQRHRHLEDAVGRGQGHP